MSKPLRGPAPAKPAILSVAPLAPVAPFVPVALAVLALSSLVLSSCLPSEAPVLRAGDPAPDFAAASLKGGRPVSLEDYRGRTLLVNLWATWCHPCKLETPYLQSLYEEHRDRGLRILGVSVDTTQDLDMVVDFVEEMGVEYDIALDPAATSRDVFFARGLPTSVVIDRTGIVAFTWIGPVTEGDPTFLGGLEDALAR